MTRTYCIYILANRSRNLYTGVTGNLEPRMVEHRQGLTPGFTTRYRIFRLVYFEFFSDVRTAIAREKEIKGWRREKKIWLINRNNPTWADLAEKLPHQYQIKEPPKQIPHPRSPKPGDRVRDDNARSIRHTAGVSYPSRRSRHYQLQIAAAGVCCRAAVRGNQRGSR
jgi:putative endonuclease